MARLVSAAKAVVLTPDLSSARVYTHLSEPSDLTLILTWESKSPPEEGSAVGLTIVDGIAAFGLVNHSILVEEEIGEETVVAKVNRRYCQKFHEK